MFQEYASFRSPHHPLSTAHLKTGDRACIDTFFFRAMAMVPAARRMVLNMEYPIPPMANS